ncbi:MAG: hypothetical protein SGI96_15800 [Bacteroidota bacterium]|nr:hypothetical protein [Bacteroidota bacterium]
MEEFVVMYHDYDLLVIPLVLIFFYILGRSIVRKIESREMRNFFIYGLVFKMIATIIFGLVIQYYFGGGDTNRYYVALLDLKKAINDDPANLLHIYGNIQLTPDNPVAQYIHSDKLGDNLGYMVKTSNFMVPRSGVLFSYVFGNSYTALSMCYSFFAFWGGWKCFNVFADIYPHVRKGLAICFLFFPSVVYWGSAITKDSICVGSLGLFVYSFYQLFFGKKSLALHITSMIIWGAVLFFTKPYLLLGLVPALSLWYFLKVNKSIKDKGLRYLSFAVLLVIIAACVLYLIQFMLNLEFLELDKYKAENIAQYATSSQEGYNQAGGSNFNIGTLDGSLGSLVSMFPKAVNATLFRPYIWEVNSPIMLISAFESLIIFCLFMYAIIKLGLRKFFSSIFSSPILVFMFVYSFFLSGLVAITTNNFGSLVRYKIPVMPFFLAMIIILLAQIPGIQKNKIITKYFFSKVKK